MRRSKFKVLMALLFAGIANFAFAQSSVLASGNWYKVAVEHDGVYKINYGFLKKMGIDPSKIDPRKIRIYGNPGGMLPQPISVERITDLQENAIQVQGEADGKFDRNDVILFFGSGPDRIEYNVGRNIFQYENNLYSEKNFYFLTIGDSNGKRISESPDLGIGHPGITTFNDCLIHELDAVNELKSGREWYGEKLGVSTNQVDINFSITGISNTSSIKLVSDVVGQTYTSGKFKTLINDVLVLEQPILPIPKTTYGAKGIHIRDTVTFTGATISAAGKTQVKVQYQFEEGPDYSQGYLDYFLLDFTRELKLYNDQTIFLSRESLNNTSSGFQIESATSTSQIWDISDVANVKSQAFSFSNSQAKFATNTSTLKRFIIFKNAEAPDWIGKISNQNLHGFSVPNLLIVTTAEFRSEAERLAQHREGFSNWTTAIATPDQIFNEFSGGRQDVTAIRDFVKYLYNKNASSLKALLLFGRASYDYKDRITENTNLVPTYESRNSLLPLETYSSDDYFGFLEDSEGQWLERPQPQNHTLDIGVGRLPVKSLDEARSVVDKIIDYDINKSKAGYWRKKMTFVADDGNSDDGFSETHQEQANDLADFVESLDPSFDSRKLFMGIYPKTTLPETVPEMKDDILRTFDRGSVVINFTGHGSERQWTDENIFNKTLIAELDNDIYPFLVTATCEFGRQDNPKDVSGAVDLVVKDNGGAIGLVSTARPVNSTTNFNLNMAFYDALLQKTNNTYPTLGEVFKNTKNNSISGVSNRNFSLLGDPSMTLALPSNVIHVSSVKTAGGSDTLKALSNVIAIGEIRNSNNEKLTDFNGVVEATLYDKQTRFVTIGRNDPPFEYTQWDNALFRGKATVKDGEFQIEFIIPKNIAYNVEQGKLSLYAADSVAGQDANGYYSDFKIGESEAIISDLQGPAIELYMEDATFVSGGSVSPDTRLVARLSDDSGINISNYGLGNGLVAILDGGVATYALNDYYIADKDDYTSGWVEFPLQDLDPGTHTLMVKAWDVNNNSSEASIDFVVSGEELRVETFGNYPNPFVDKSTLFFTHNRAGDELQAQVFIQKSTGELVGTAEVNVPDSGYRVDLMEINSGNLGDKKLAPGLYLARLIVRSLTNGSKNEQVTKLIILN